MINKFPKTHMLLVCVSANTVKCRYDAVSQNMMVDTAAQGLGQNLISGWTHKNTMGYLLWGFGWKFAVV